MDLNEAKNFLVEIMQELYVFLRPRIKKDISLLVGMGFRHEDSQRLIKDMRKRIEEVLNRKKLQPEEYIRFACLTVYNFYDLRFCSKYSSWFRFMYVTDFDKSKLVRALYNDIDEDEMRDFLIDILVSSSRFFYAYNMDRDMYDEEVQQLKDKDCKNMYDRINDDEFKSFFDKL